MQHDRMERRSSRMDRRKFLQGITIATAGMNGLPALAAKEPEGAPQVTRGVAASRLLPAKDVDIQGHTLLCSFKRNTETWKVYEDLRTRDGAISFVSSSGHGMVLTK